MTMLLAMLRDHDIVVNVGNVARTTDVAAIKMDIGAMKTDIAAVKTDATKIGGLKTGADDIDISL